MTMKEELKKIKEIREGKATPKAPPETVEIWNPIPPEKRGK
jgi:hypothetical protein